MFSMPSATLVRRRTFALVPVLAALVIAAPVAAGQPAVQQLNPEPPAAYTCTPNGTGTVCYLTDTVMLDPEPIGLTCDLPSGSFEIYDEGTRTLSATRWYDRDGNLVKRVRVNEFDDTQLSNPASGSVVPYVQRDRDVEVFTIPGDLSSAVWTSTGSLTATVPGMGAVLVERGRVEVAPDGELIAFTGRRDAAALFEGDPEVLGRICQALAD